MSNEKLNKFSEDLKKIREKKNITIEQISSKTRIDKKFLVAIEEADFDVIDNVYIRAFLKEYAQVIEVDVDEVMMKYELAKRGKEEKPAEEAIEEKDIVQKEKKDKVYTDKSSDLAASDVPPVNGNNKEKVIIIRISIAAAFILAIISIYFLFIKESSTEIIKEQPYEEIVAEQNQRYEETAEANKEVDRTITAADSLTLRITTSDTSWVRVLADGSITTEFILLPNIQKVIKAEYDFELLIGNASGIKLFLNEKELEFVGLKRQVRNVIIDKNGIK